MHGRSASATVLKRPSSSGTGRQAISVGVWASRPLPRPLIVLLFGDGASLCVRPREAVSLLVYPLVKGRVCCLALAAVRALLRGSESQHGGSAVTKSVPSRHTLRAWRRWLQEEVVIPLGPLRSPLKATSVASTCLHSAHTTASCEMTSGGGSRGAREHFRLARREAGWGRSSGSGPSSEVGSRASA